MRVLSKTALAAGTATLALGLGAASASAVTVHFENNGVPGLVAPPGTTLEAEASVAVSGATGKLVDYTTGNTAATCTKVTAFGNVGAGSTSLNLTSVTFTSCSSPVLGPLTVTLGGLPWNFTASGASSPFPGTLTNWLGASAAVSAAGCTATYTAPGSPTGFSVVNTSGGSSVTALKAGPLSKSGSCALPSSAGLSGTIKVTKVNGAAATPTNNLWGV